MSESRLPHYIVSFAQNREDVILSGFFKGKAKGFYVDIGANDPDLDSVTKLFYDQGWSGINVDPIKKHYDSLALKRPKDINIQIGIADKAGKLKFREFHKYHGLSTFASEMVKQYEEYTGENSGLKDYEEYDVDVITLKQLLARYKVPHIDFLKIDVEGYEYDVLVGNDWSRYRPSVVCVEANHIHRDWRSILKKNKYQLKFFDGLNEYYTADEYKTEFSYTETLLSTPILDYRLLDILDYYEKEKIQTKVRVEEVLQELHLTQHHLYVVTEELKAAKQFKGLVKNLVRKVDNIIEEKILTVSLRDTMHPIKGDATGSIDVSLRDPVALLKEIKRYDKENFKRIHLPQYKTRRLVLSIYRAIKKPAKVGLKLGVKALKKAKHLPKGQR